MAHPLICYSAPEVAKVTGLSLSLVRKSTRNGKIPHLKVGRRIIYPVTAIHEWLLTNTIGSTPTEKGDDSDG